MLAAVRSLFAKSLALNMLCVGAAAALIIWLGIQAVGDLWLSDPIYLAENAIEADATVLETRQVRDTPNTRFGRATYRYYVRFNFIAEDGRTYEAESEVSALVYSEVRAGDAGSAFYLHGKPGASSFGTPAGIRPPARLWFFVDLIMGMAAAAVLAWCANRALIIWRGYGFI
jgi:hypothetical protein